LLLYYPLKFSKHRINSWKIWLYTT
jgi:hypothetical protein